MRGEVTRGDIHLALYYCTVHERGRTMFLFPQIPLKVELSQDYSWVAMDEPTATGSLAPTVSHSSKDASKFIIRVRYYVHVVLCFGMLHRAISMKLPYLLKRTTK